MTTPHSQKNMLSKFDQFETTHLKSIENRLDELVPESTESHKTLFEAARYTLHSPGKKLRPLLTLATTQCLNGSLEQALIPACAIELIHTYSLIHDDLPSMDNDDFRRGQPTLHKMFPEGIAILAGDFLLTHTFEILSDASGLSPDQKLDLIKTLAHHSGGNGMIGGQILDIQAENRTQDLESLQRIHQLKTGNLITAAIEFGAIISGTTDEFRKKLIQYGEMIGLAFQMIDDVLDVTQSQMKHGKDYSSDLANQKSTYVTLLGLEETQRQAKSLINFAKEQLASLPFDTQLLQDFADRIGRQQ